MTLSCHRIWFVVFALAACLAASEGSAADLYLRGGLSISLGVGDSGGAVQFPPTPPIPFTGSDSDTSPVLSGAIGYGFPLSELVPLDRKSPLPRWPLRFELEGGGGRDYEFVTRGGDPYLTHVTSWSILHNIWMDLPVHEAVSAAVGRVPILEPMSFTLGGGVGVAQTNLSTTNVALHGSDSSFHLTWQVGAGLGYQLTERVSVDIGYRYVSLGKFDYPMVNPPSDPVGSFSMELASHELVTGLRVNFYGLPSPGAWASPPGR